MKQATILILTNNHFDPTWRRCWDRRLIFRGREFVSYAELEDYYITDNLEIARANPEYVFEVESPVVLRKYLDRHPECADELRGLAASGRFGVSGAGDNIIDTNMVLGESIVRNYLRGLLWVEDTLGTVAKLAVRTDGFGNSAQLPQILRGCEFGWVTGLSYSPASGRYWRGLDGSVVCHAYLPPVAECASWAKHPPCSRCSGKGCEACNGRGIEPGLITPLPPDQFDHEALSKLGAGIIQLGGEEALPNPEIVEWARRSRDAYDIRFALLEDAHPWLKVYVECVDNPAESEVHPSVELNPNNTGVFVTRIKTKQVCRRLEYALLGSETLAALAAMRGACPSEAVLTSTWQTLLFTMFHDAITGTHVDAAYDELCDMYTAVENGVETIRAEALGALVEPDSGCVSVINSFGAAATQVVSVVVPSDAEAIALVGPDGIQAPIVRQKRGDDGSIRVDFIARSVPSLGASVYKVVSGTREVLSASTENPVIENERFRVTADDRGILEILDKTTGAVISGAGAYRPGELVAERDEGSPWATIYPDRTRRPLSSETRLLSVERGPASQSISWQCSVASMATDVGQFYVDAVSTVTLYAGIERVDFVTEVDWDAINVRLRVAMPVSRPGKCMYGIPYGMIERQPYVPTFHEWTGANGDWPAVDWAGVEGNEVSVALLNKGLPSYAVETGPNGDQTMFLSVLRSPHMPTYLHEPQFCSMTDYDGMRDAGSHRFEYALTAYDVPFARSSVVGDAESYNAGLLAVSGHAKLPEAPVVSSDCVRVSCIKQAEKDHAMIIRLWEYRGQGGWVRIGVPETVKTVSRVNLLERRAVLVEIENGAVAFEMKPWQIATLRLDIG
jgi:alpha-mannosidase